LSVLADDGEMQRRHAVAAVPRLLLSDLQRSARLLSKISPVRRTTRVSMGKRCDSPGKSIGYYEFFIDEARVGGLLERGYLAATTVALVRLFLRADPSGVL